MTERYPVKIDCADCAAKLEGKLSQVPGVENIAINFVAGTITLTADDASFAETLEKVKAEAKKIEPECEILDNLEKDSSLVKKTWHIEIDCASCAATVEAAISSLEGVRSAAVNFVGKTLTIVMDKATQDEVIARVVETAKRVEPDCEIFIEDAANNENADSGKRKIPVQLVKILISAVLFAVSFFLPYAAQIVAACCAYLISGYDVIIKAVRNIFHGKVFDENFLMTVASLGSLAMGNFSEAAAVMVLYQIGEYFQDIAVEKSRNSVASLMDIRPDYANLIDNGITRKVSPEEVNVGNLILVKPGEKIPLDGVITDGSTSLNTVALTGESVPRDAAAGDSVLSGCINMTGAITVEVKSTYGESTVAKILELVENSGENKAQSEKFITKFSRIYTPCVCAAALLLAFVPPIFAGNLMEWIRRALTFLVISCPCALVISVPLSFFCGIGGASSRGILIKGANHMETLAKVDTMVFDKTGTLTKGVFQVVNVNPEGISRDELLEKAAYAESFSNHPIGKSILAAFGGKIDQARVTDVEEISGKGLSASVAGKRITCGNRNLMADLHIECPEVKGAGTVVYAAEDGKYLGSIVISDVIKDNAGEAMAKLKLNGVSRLIMLTGDRQTAAQAVADELGLTEFHAELMPGDKVQHLEAILNTKGEGKVAFIGDGINDAPVLRRADIGIAMGAMGSDAAIEAADVVLMDDNVAKLPLTMKIARKTMRIVKENIVFALIIKLAVLVLGAFGIANMWLAVLADVGVCMAAIVNAMRAMRIK